MCAIAGVVDYKKYNLPLMLDTLKHRGPDESNIVTFDNVALLHNRLSIQDIKHGHQPFTFKNYTIVFNGEIYNHLELRKSLKEFTFKTLSDTETLLYLYIKYKEDMFEMIDGMFAFCIFDKAKKRFFFARDRAGKKPLYIYQKDKDFAFASEINALKTLDLTVDEKDIKLYLSTGFCESGYREIKEFPPGCFGVYEGGILKIEKYFDIFDFYQKEKIKDFNEALHLTDENLTKSVKDRLFSSDVEVGAFLSGGIDSSLIVAKTSEFTKLKTFTVRFEGQFDESHLAALVAKKYDTNHTVIDIKLELKENIIKILNNYGKPFFDSSAIPSYFVSREARKYVKVILNGDGADEIFAGYRRYVPLANGWDKIAKYFDFLLPFLSPKSRGLKMFVYRLIRASNKEGLEWYNVMLNDLFIDYYNINIENLDNFIKNIKLDNFEKLLYLDYILNLRYNLLVKMDIATMSNSLEGRSPFLSKYFLETVPRFDKSFKVRGLKTKFILRELAKKYLPKELVNAPKRGFEIPLIEWINGELRDIVMDYLKNGFYKNFIDEKLVKSIIDRKIEISEEKRAKILYLLFSLEVWAYENRVS